MMLNAETASELYGRYGSLERAALTQAKGNFRLGWALYCGLDLFLKRGTITSFREFRAWARRELRKGPLQ